jgi:light-regulated signal transduction histidine kinase (bacteriophytochrome)
MGRLGTIRQHHSEPFRRPDAESSFLGTAIGLSIARRIADRHGGKIRAWRERRRWRRFFECSVESSGPSPTNTKNW